MYMQARKSLLFCCKQNLTEMEKSSYSIAQILPGKFSTNTSLLMSRMHAYTQKQIPFAITMLPNSPLIYFFFISRSLSLSLSSMFDVQIPNTWLWIVFQLFNVHNTYNKDGWLKYKTVFFFLLLQLILNWHWQFLLSFIWEFKGLDGFVKEISMWNKAGKTD